MTALRRLGEAPLLLFLTKENVQLVFSARKNGARFIQKFVSLPKLFTRL